MSHSMFVLDWYEFSEHGNLHSFCLQLDTDGSCSPSERNQAFREIEQWCKDLDLTRDLWAYRVDGPTLTIVFKEANHAMLFRLKFC